MPGVPKESRPEATAASLTISMLNRKSSRAILIIIFSVAVGLRIGIFFYLYSQAPLKYALFDLDGYVNIAHNLVENGVYSQELTPPYQPDLVRPPIYPLFLAGNLALFQTSLLPVAILQLLLGSLAVIFLYGLSNNLGFSYLTGLIAAGILALDPILILLGNYPLTEMLFITIFLVALWLLVRFLATENYLFLVSSAILWGLGALTRPVLLFLPLALTLPFIIKARSGNRKGWLKSAALFVLISYAITVPWFIRNFQTANIISLSTISNTNLLYYRAKAVLADAEHISQANAKGLLEAEIEAAVTSGNLSLSEQLALERTRALEILAQYPAGTLAMTAKGTARLLFDPGYSLICALLDPTNLSVECFPGTATMLDSNLGGQAFNQIFAFNWIQRLLLVWAFLITGLTLVGAVGGIILLWRARNWPVLGLFIPLLVYFVLLSSGAESSYRLRVPIIPILALLTGVSLDWLVAQARRRRQGTPAQV